jgi:hypothetical protein
MVSGIAAKNENGTDTMSITITMVTGKTANTIVTATKTTIKKFYARSSEPRKGQKALDIERNFNVESRTGETTWTRWTDGSVGFEETSREPVTQGTKKRRFAL